MKHTWYLPLIFLLSLGLMAQDRQFKGFYVEGKKLMESGDYQGAIDKFNEAYRREKKAKRYKESGNFFDYYLPRYRLALCYEQVDIMQGEAWANASKEALEEDVIRKKKDILATYHKDLERIINGANAKRAELRQAYDLKISDAQSLLANNRFDEAKKVFTEAAKLDASRTEAQAGIATIEGKRANYIDKLSMNVERAMFRKDWNAAQTELAQIKAVDSNNSKIAVLQQQINEAKEQARLAALPKEEKKVVTVDPPPKPKPTKTQPTRDPAADAAARAKRTAAAKKASVREALLESVSEYRRGFPADALARLENIDATDGAKFSSYHWLKGVYLLSMYQHGEGQDSALQDRARASMLEVAKAMPQFKPDAKLYPDFVLTFYESLN